MATIRPRDLLTDDLLAGLGGVGGDAADIAAFAAGQPVRIVSEG